MVELPKHLDFHIKGLPFQRRVWRINEAAEHPNAAEWVDEFEAVLKEPFAPQLHADASDALLKIHDKRENSRDKTVLEVLAAWHAKLVEDYIRGQRPVGLQHLLEKTHEELTMRGLKRIAEIPREEPYRRYPAKETNATSRSTSSLSSNAENELRRILAAKHRNGQTYSWILGANPKLNSRIDILMEAALGPLTSQGFVGKLYIVEETSLNTNKKTLEKIGIKIVKSTPFNGKLAIDIEVAPTLEKFLREYVHKP